MKKFLADLWSYFIFALILIGIGGISWRTFSDNGWAEQLLGAVWQAEVRYPLIATPIVIGTVYMTYVVLHGGLKAKGERLLGNVMVFVMSACGAYFVFEWIRAAYFR